MCAQDCAGDADRPPLDVARRLKAPITTGVPRIEDAAALRMELLADIKEGGKIASLTNIDERIYNKAISRLKTLIRDSLVRYK